MPKKHTLSCLAAAVAASIASTAPARADARGVEMALPAYVWPGDPFLAALEDPARTPTPPSIVIVNIGNGDGDVSILDADADRLRARTTPSGDHVLVLGYVYTSRGARDENVVNGRVDTWLGVRNGSVHYDGIFFDEVPRECNAAGAAANDWRDKYLRLANHVRTRVPGAVVVDNPGTAIFDCYLEAGHRTADVFITYEDTAANYLAGWVGGNVVANNQYVLGTQYGADSFWHLVYGATADNWRAVADTAYARFAGHLDVTDDIYTNGLLNPWDQIPSFLNDAINYVATLGD